MTTEIKRTSCPICPNKNTEFVQFASGDEETVETTVDEVDGGLLELRLCNECGAGIENVLTVDQKKAIRQ